MAGHAPVEALLEEAFWYLLVLAEALLVRRTLRWLLLSLWLVRCMSMLWEVRRQPLTLPSASAAFLADQRLDAGQSGLVAWEEVLWEVVSTFGWAHRPEEGRVVA